MYSEKMGGRVKADATVMMSLMRSNPREATGKALGLATPKCLMYAASLRIPQTVLTVNVIRRFWMGMGRPGMISEWSVRLLAPQVIVQTKYIQRNLQEVKNCNGVVNKRVKPPRTPSCTVCLPFANQMTERSRIALLGETTKAVTVPETISCQAGQPFLGQSIPLSIKSIIS